jgi:hypothetical protein
VTSLAATRLNRLTCLFCAYILVAVVTNLLVPRAFLSEKVWRYPQSVPGIPPLGADLRIFVQASYNMYMGDNPLWSNYNSPPLTAAVFFPFNLMSYELAYEVQFTLNVLENAGALLLLFLLFRPVVESASGPAKLEAAPSSLLDLVFLVACVTQFIGYPFEFALERGNYDSLALLAICAGAWLVRRMPGACWLQVLLFSFAAHLKVYPAILLFIPLWRHGRRALLPLVVVNGLMLFCFGFDRGIEFLTGLYQYSQHPYIWPGNHSAVSFAAQALEPGLGRGLSPTAAHGLSVAVLAVVPVALWIYGTLKLVKQGFSEWSLLLALGLATPVMCLLPSVSNDYKLVIIILPASVCLTHYALGYLRDGAWPSLLGLAGTLLCLLLVTRSTLYSPSIWIANKYPPVLLLEVLTLIAAVQNRALPVMATAVS